MPAGSRFFPAGSPKGGIKLKQSFETFRNTRKTVVFSRDIPVNTSGYIDSRLVAHGSIEKVRVNFATGENDLLHIRPVAIIPGEITLDLFQYADGGNAYVSGDSETIESDVGVEIENDTILRVYYENTNTNIGDDPGKLNVKITVNYFETIELENIIGPRTNI